MGQIGSLGDVVFEVSSEKVQTFKDLKRNSAARIATHEIIGQKPILEFIAPGLEEISFTMHLNIGLGVNIKETLDLLRTMRDGGRVVDLIIAGEPITDNKWLVTSLSESVNFTDGEGNLLSVDVEVSLKEYLRGSSP